MTTPDIIYTALATAALIIAALHICETDPKYISRLEDTIRHFDGRYMAKGTAERILR